MAAATDFNAGLDASTQLEGSLSRTSEGLGESQLLRNFATQTIPDLANNYSSRGTFYGGSLGVAGDQAKQAATDEVGAMRSKLAQTLADLTRQGIIASTGVQL